MTNVFILIATTVMKDKLKDLADFIYESMEEKK